MRIPFECRPVLIAIVAVAVIAMSTTIPAAAKEQSVTQTDDCEFESAITAFNQNKSVQAKELFEACIAANNEMAASSFYLGILARNAKDLPKARTLLTRAAKLNPASIGYRLELAVTHEWMSNLETAQQIYKTVLSEDAQNLPARIGSARMDHWRGNVARSIKSYQALNQEYPDHTGIRSGLAMALLADGKLDQSRLLLEKNLAANPNDAGAKQGLAMIDKTRKQTVDFYASTVRAADGQTSRRIQLLVAAQINYRWRLLAELSSGRKNSTVVNGNANAGGKATKSEASLTTVYRFSTKTTGTFGLKYQWLENDKTQLQLQVAGAHNLTPDQTISYGLIPTLTGSRLTSTLGYAGYSYTTSSRWVVSGTVYRGWDRDAANSVAGSITVGKEYSSRSSIRIGLSASRTGATSASTVFGQIQYPLSKNMAANLRFNESLSGKEREISLGLRIEF